MYPQGQKLLISIAQILFFASLPFLWWFIMERKKIGFFQWVRSKRISFSDQTARTLSVAGVTVVLLAIFYVEKNAETALSGFLGFLLNGTPAVLFYAVLNSSLPDQLLLKAKPSLFERGNQPRSLGMAFFPADTCVEQVTGADGKRYRALAIFTLHVPKETASLAEESISGLLAEEVADFLAEPLESALRSLIGEYDGTADFKALAAEFRKRADEAVAMFGVAVLSVKEIRIVEES